jgi:hypothetical protein
MVMALFMGMCRSDPQYSAVNGREAKYTRLGYMTRLSRLHTLDPPFSISFSEEQSFSTPDPKQENNQGTPDKVAGTSSIPTCDKFAQLELEARQGKVTDHMRDKYAKNRHKIEA